MTWIAWLPAIAPLAYLVASKSPARAVSITKTSLAAGWVSLAAACGGLLCALTTGVSTSPTLGVAGLGLSVRLDVLSGLLCCLIAFLGLVVVGYSRNYLAGAAGQGRFMRQLCLTLGLLQALVLSGNLAQLVACWIGAGVGVNRLLLFRPERQAAVLASRKHFLVSRLADTALTGAALLLWRAAGSGDIGVVLAAAGHGVGAEWATAAALLALAAVLSAAQAPFHGWILEVMETPTPVSALLHAGVVNAGGFLMLRFADVVGSHSAALGLLTMVGATSAIFGSLVMLPQTSVKVALAFSTIAQMGFMLLECGLGAYSAALLHIVAHALYKAHAFLTAGSGVAAPRRPAEPTRRSSMSVLAAPLLVAVAALAMTAMGLGPLQQPGRFVLVSVALLGLARPWLARRDRRGLLAAAALSAVLVPAYVVGQALFGRLVGDLGPQAGPPQPVSIATAIGMVTAMTAVVCVQLRAPGRSGSEAWARAYALVASGFHLNTIANRWVLRFWPAVPPKSTAPGAA